MPRTPEVQAVIDSLMSEGFAEDVKKYKVDPALSENGPYEVWGRLKRGKLAILIEQNNVIDNSSGYNVMTSYPPVAILEKGETRVACDATDLELILSVAGDLDG